MKVPDLEVGKRLFVGCGSPTALKTGAEEVRGSAYIQGPVQVGEAGDFGSINATVMIGNDTNDESDAPPRSLHVQGNARIAGDGDTTFALNVSGGSAMPLFCAGDGMFAALSPPTLTARFSSADGKPKPFDIEHPSKKGYRLRYSCIEGPETGVYYRGRLQHKSEIELPYYWKDLVHEDSISVQLQPIGAHQDIIVKRWDSERIYLQAKAGLPINCFYHVYAERKDINPLITEYEGESCSDYPDPNFHTVPEGERVYNDPQYAGPQNTVTR